MAATTLDNTADVGPLFREADDVVPVVRALTTDPPEPTPSDRTFEWVTQVLDKYQEQPVLLDSHLEAIVGPLMVAVRRGTAEGDTPRMRELMRVVYVLCKVRGYKTIVRFFPHQVSDLEPAAALLASVTNSSGRAQDGTWQVAYGCQLWLSVLMLLPFDLNIIDSSLVAGPTGAKANSRAEEVGASIPAWAEHASAGARLGVDGGGSVDAQQGTPRPAGLIVTVIEMAKIHLASSGPARDAAAVLLARLLTRPRMHAHLSAFVLWATEVIAQADVEAADSAAAGAGTATAHMEEMGGTEAPAGTSTDGKTHAAVAAAGPIADPSRPFLVVGAHTALAACLKLGDRSELRMRLPQLCPLLLPAARPSKSTLYRKLRCKLTQRIGLLLLPPRVAAWRYDRGARSLLGNLLLAGVKGAGGVGSCGIHATSVRLGAGDSADGAVADGGDFMGGGQAKAGAGVAGDGAADAADAEEGDDDADVPEETEDVVEHVLSALRDEDTIVRWSGAKGVGRIVSRLPRDLGDEVVASVMECFGDAEEHAAWHGGCLALAELARRGLLLPERLAAAVPLVCRALSYDLFRGAHSVGQHVRDAASYACWAFARAYTPRDMAPHVRAVATALLVTACFDREVNCRRAAAAAFQENVGRQGNLPHGIAIMGAADYHGVSSRARAFLHVSRFVAGFPEYSRPLLEHLVAVKSQHWDEAVRALAARAAGVLCSSDATFCAREALPRLAKQCLAADLRARHGAALMSAELTLAIARLGGPSKATPAVAPTPEGAPASALSPGSTEAGRGEGERAESGLLTVELMATIQGIVPGVEKARLYRGRGGEAMRAASCRVLECSALARLPSTGRAQMKLVETTIVECLRHPSEGISAAAAAALGAVSAEYLVSDAAVRSTQLGAKFAKMLATDDNPAVTRGAALALAVLPREQLLAAADEVVAALTGAAALPDKVELRDPETRRNAVRAISAVAREMGIALPAPSAVPGAPPSGSASAPAAEAPAVAASAHRGGLTEANFQRLWGQLLACLGDYETDKRGDVGSWVREAAMRALADLANLAVEAQSVRDDACRRGVPQAALSTVWTTDMATALASALVQQSHEKIDRTRALAAGVLGRVLAQESPRIGGMASRESLAAIYVPLATAPPGAAAEGQVDDGADETAADADGGADTEARGAASRSVSKAAAPATGLRTVDTFAWTVRTLRLHVYAPAVLLGTIVSIGSLTESTVRSAGGALVSFLQGCDSADLVRFVEQVAALVEKHEDDERVLLPALRAIEFVCASGVLHTLREAGGAGAPDMTTSASHQDAPAGPLRAAPRDMAVDPTAPTDVLALRIRDQAKGVREPRRLIATAAAQVAILPLASVPVRRSLLRTSIINLAHRYPRIRRATADALYEHFLANEADLPASAADEVTALIASTAWDGPDAEVRTVRDEFLRLWSFEPPAVRKAELPRAVPVEEVNFGTYTDLVRDAGY